ncbi:hypothetical protein ASPZODRAFT_17412 [Penicilliopsis zonata CBS 506.65]|uniref:Glutamate-1-semialdehyde 2,1-aminomutase n=1 Tax=Penicilliopsis zonata CBS 506.65 TaxID=1073090 RepID=A0A1L9SDC3_9EURO|nr:hypothetical protein ASPZODRAFT_17412 [Penicilliopsis zonata CBS 506.65]OJJ45196.1 hypothetical protein ASPZODRAFT_17412 [Penicilliopsis zonata CBS 506.65]
MGDAFSIDEALRQAKDSYISTFPESQTRYEEALEVMPGGNTRSVLFTAPFPVFMKKGKGNRLWDCDGNEYLDLVGELTAGLYGHSHPRLRQALLSAYDTTGISLGATTTEEMRFARLICGRFPSIEHIRFCNSGTEANLYALSVARRVTGKRKVIAFDGGYHGGVLGFAHGVGENNVDPGDWVLGEYNNVENAKNLIQDTPEVAAVIVEAMQGAGGCIPASLEFLKTVQDAAASRGVIFILDEVMTSRLHPTGLQGKYALKPDLTTLGKYLGGGLAFGAFGGRRSLLSAYDPRLATSLAHSGTFNNNSLAMSCGYVGLSEIYTAERATELNALGDSFRESLQDVARGTKLVVTGIGAVMNIHFMSNGQAPACAADLEAHSVSGLKKLFWYWSLSKGFWITERGMMSIILDTEKSELDTFVEAVKGFVKRYQNLLQIKL